MEEAVIFDGKLMHRTQVQRSGGVHNTLTQCAQHFNLVCTTPQLGVHSPSIWCAQPSQRSERWRFWCAQQTKAPHPGPFLAQKLADLYYTPSMSAWKKMVNKTEAQPKGLYRPFGLYSLWTYLLITEFV